MLMSSGYAWSIPFGAGYAMSGYQERDPTIQRCVATPQYDLNGCLVYPPDRNKKAVEPKYVYCFVAASSIRLFLVMGEMAVTVRIS